MTREIEFKNWLTDNVQNLATVTKYIKTLKVTIPKKLQSLNETNYENLFDCKDLDYIKNIYNRLLKGGDLVEFNNTTQNMLPSAAIKQYINFLENQSTNKTINTKNIILYGAPGVGKTYNHKKLISLIESGEFSQNEIFSAIVGNEDKEDLTYFENVEKENRFKFVTFHQSYSYEDFIEGFRPDQETGELKISKGVFKNLAKEAKENKDKSEISEQKENIFDIKSLIEIFTEDIKERLDNNEVVTLGDNVIIESINENGSFLLGGSVKSNTQRLTTELLERDYLGFKKGEINSYKDIKPTYDSQKTFHGNARYYFMLNQKLAEFEKALDKKDYEVEKQNLKKYYIIIDEINRGNISKIFGELITLIEDDKRDNLSVELPYSREDFTVPSNLYIIATMNTTDKSIALLDVALRRRFTFLKMKPLVEVVEYENAKDLMKKLNEEILNTLGEDYLIGHGYFTNVNSEEDLEFVKRYKILPLLEEYFYGDDEKLKSIKDILKIEGKI